MALVVKNLPASARDVRDVSLTPGSGRSPGAGNGNPLKCSCLENPMDRGAWRAAQHIIYDYPQGVRPSLSLPQSLVP